MLKQLSVVRFLGAVFLVLTVTGTRPLSAAPPEGAGGGNGILDRLAAIESQLAGIVNKLDAPSTSATFCISQGRGLELGADWALGLENEITAGVGWPNVIRAHAAAKPTLPFVIPLGPIPVPLPTETMIGIKGGLGRGQDICIEIPVQLTDDDQMRLEQLARDINTDTGNDDPGKYQRRAGRILNYAAVRVPGVQQSLETRRSGIAAPNAAGDIEGDFDRADSAVESLLDGGFGEATEGMDVFRDQNIKELLATLELPVEVNRYMDDPEQILDALPDVGNGDGKLHCNDVGISAGMRTRHARLDGLCGRLEDLPDYESVKNASERIAELPDEILDAIAVLMEPVLDKTNGVSETATQTKSRFCASTIGQRRAFDRYCGRT
jgi:hypothetical protein